MIEIAVASITFAILMYLILKNRKPEEKFARNTENDIQDLPEIDVDDATGTDNAATEDLSQEESNPEIEPGHYKSDKENLSSVPSERNDMLVLLVYYYQTIVKIIELIMSKRALRKRFSRRDNYESMLPLSRSSKESDILAPTASYEENSSDDSEEEQDLEDEFEMKHQEASIENLEVFIAQRRKLETYLQHYDNIEIDISSSEETDNDESDIAVPPPDTFKTDNEGTISDIEKALLIESELVALLIDESPCEESEYENISENSVAKSLDETKSEMYNKYTSDKSKSLPSQRKLSDNDEIFPQEKNILSNEIVSSFEENNEESNILETDITIKVSEGVVESECVEQLVTPKESEIYEDDITLQELEYNYEEESEISDTLINEILNDSSKHSYSSDNENFEKSNYDLTTDYIEMTQESKISESNMKIKESDIVLESNFKETILPTLETYICEDPKTLKELVNSNQADSEISEPLNIENLNYNCQNLQTLSRECLEKTSHDDKGELESDMQYSLIGVDMNECLETDNVSSNDKPCNIDNNGHVSTDILTVGNDEILDDNQRLELNLTLSDQDFETLYKESINSAAEDTNEYGETFMDETFNSEGLSKDIDNVSKTSLKKSFRNKVKRKRCMHKALESDKVSHKDNEDENDDETLINNESSQSDLQDSSSETETREEVQPMISETTVSVDKGRKYGQVSEYILLKEIEQVESLIREAVAENSNLSDSFVESFFGDENNTSESAGSFQKDSRNLEPIKEETAEDTNTISNGKADNEKLSLFDDKNKDASSLVVSKTVSDNNGCKMQDVYDFEEAYAVCEYEEVSEDVYETFCDESDFMVPVIKRDDEWWTTLSDKDTSQFETVGDKNKAFNNLESIPKSTENKKKNSVPKKVSFCADNDLATIIVDNIDREHLAEHTIISLSSTDNYFDTLEIYDDNHINNVNTSLFTTEVSDFMMELDTYDDIDKFNNDDIRNVLSSYESIGNLVSVDEYDTKSKQTKNEVTSLAKLPEEHGKRDYQTETHENINDYVFLTEYDSALRNSYNDKFSSEKVGFVCTDENSLDFDTISSLDECKAFEAEANNSDENSKYISYARVERDYLEGDFIDHINMDECAAFEASDECDLMVGDFIDHSNIDECAAFKASDECDLMVGDFIDLSNIDESAAFEAYDECDLMLGDFIDHSNMDECAAFKASDECDLMVGDFIDHSNMDECAAFEASDEYDLKVLSPVDNIDNLNSLNHKVDDSEENAHKPHVQDTFLDESFFVSQTIDHHNHPGKYQAPSLDEKNNGIKLVNEMHLSKRTSSECESVDKIAHSIGNEISYDGCLSRHEDETEAELYISSSGDRLDVHGNDTKMEVEYRISNFDEDITQLDKCKAFTETSEPTVIEEAVVSKIKELESQMKAIESCLDSPNNTSDSNISTDQKDRNATSSTHNEKIPNISYIPINITGHEYIPIVSHEGSSENLKSETASQLLESEIYQSNDDKCKAHHQKDIHIFETQLREILPDQYDTSNFNDEIYVKEKRGQDYKSVDISITKIDQCKAFKADEFDIESTLTVSEVSTYLPIVESDAESGTPLIIDHTSHDLLDSNVSQSNIDQCKAFHAESKRIESDPYKSKLLPDEERDEISVKGSAEYITDLFSFVQDSRHQATRPKPFYNVNEYDFLESYISYSNIDQCTAFHAVEIQLSTSELKEVANEYIPFSYEQKREDIENDNELESSHHFYSKIDQCQAFKASISQYVNTLAAAIMPSFNTSINLPVVTLSKEESDYTLSVRLEKFKSLEVLQAASISQDESSYKVSFE